MSIMLKARQSVLSSFKHGTERHKKHTMVTHITANHSDVHVGIAEKLMAFYQIGCVLILGLGARVGVVKGKYGRLMVSRHVLPYIEIMG